MQTTGLLSKPGYRRLLQIGARVGRGFLEDGATVVFNDDGAEDIETQREYQDLVLAQLGIPANAKPPSADPVQVSKTLEAVQAEVIRDPKTSTFRDLVQAAEISKRVVVLDGDR